MRMYGYKTLALGGILAGSLIATPAFAHGDKYSSPTTEQPYASNDDTYPSFSSEMRNENAWFSDNGAFSSNDETSQSANDSNPDSNVAADRLTRDQREQDMRSGASDAEIIEDQLALEQARRAAEDSSDDITVIVTPSS